MSFFLNYQITNRVALHTYAIRLYRYLVVNADKTGFEPAVRFHVHALSKGGPSAAQPLIQYLYHN